jgi:hypothetical protein
MTPEQKAPGALPLEAQIRSLGGGNHRIDRACAFL